MSWFVSAQLCVSNAGPPLNALLLPNALLLLLLLNAPLLLNPVLLLNALLFLRNSALLLLLPENVVVWLSKSPISRPN